VKSTKCFSTDGCRNRISVTGNAWISAT